KNWGYDCKDKDFKSAEMMIKKLVECVSKNGNMLLNVGPDARGNIPKESLEILKNIGTWMRDHGESIYGCKASDLPKPENGRITKGENVLYYHIMENSIGGILLEGIEKEQIKSIRLLSDGSEVEIIDNWIVNNYPHAVFVSVSDTAMLPNSIDTVVKINLK
ncbi:MAG: alpha-L-fucosidase, partial [Oscillospiraceae bacterium]